VFQELVFEFDLFLIGKAKEIDGNSLSSYRDREQSQSKKDPSSKVNSWNRIGIQYDRLSLDAHVRWQVHHTAIFPLKEKKRKHLDFQHALQSLDTSSSSLENGASLLVAYARCQVLAQSILAHPKKAFAASETSFLATALALSFFFFAKRTQQ